MKKFYQLIQKNLRPSRLAELFQKKYSTVDELPLITISREKGSGGRPTAYLLAKKLGTPWKVYHKEIVDDIAEETHLEKKLIQEVDEHKIPLIEETIADFFGKRYMTFNNYHQHLIKILSAIGQLGYSIIVGRGAQNLFPHALKVRIICEMEQRIKWMMEFEKMSRYKAIKVISESDEKRLEFEKAIFNHDLRKAHHYDLVIRTGPNLSIEDAAEAIVKLAKRRFRL